MTTKTAATKHEIMMLGVTCLAVIGAVIWTWRVGQVANYDSHVAFDARMQVQDIKADIKNMEALLK